MAIEHTDIDGLLLVRWPIHADDRGFLRETHRTDEVAQALGRPVVLRQGNHARSHPGVLRGFHAEPWDKLVTVVAGTARACVADLRPDSATFGAVVEVVLGDPPGERLGLFVAEGLGNAYEVLGERPCDYAYQVTREWTPDAPRTVVRWDDPDLAAPWQAREPVLSDLDAAAPTLREVFPDHPTLAGAAS